MRLDIGDVSIGIELLPDRKKPVLTIINGVEHLIVASFVGLASAERFEKRLIEMFEEAGVRVIKENVKEADE